MPRFTKRSRRGGKSRRKGRKSRRLTVRKVSQIARRATLKLAESKRVSVVNEQYALAIPAGGVQYAYAYRNVFTVVPSGFQSYSLIGNELVDPMLKLKFTTSVPWDVIQASSVATASAFRVPSVYFHIWVIASNEQVALSSTPTALPTIGSSTDPGWIMNPWSATPHLNSNNCIVLKHKRIIHHPPMPNNNATGPNTAYPRTTKTGQILIKMRGKKVFEDLPDVVVSVRDQIELTRDTALLGWNFYILAGWGTPYETRNAYAAYPGIVDLKIDSYLYFKDP